MTEYGGENEDLGVGEESVGLKFVVDEGRVYMSGIKSSGI